MGLAMTSKKMIHAHGKDENGIIGVTIDSIDSVEGKKQILRFAGLTKTQAENIISYAYSQEGKKFNWWTFFGKSDSDKNKLSCSDIVNNSFLFAGIELSYWMPRSFMYDKRFIKINVEWFYRGHEGN